MMSDRALRSNVIDGVGECIFDRAGQANTITPAFASEFLEVVSTFVDSREVRAILFRSKGPIFSAGGDLAAFAEFGDLLPEELGQMIDTMHEALELLYSSGVPVVCAVQGAVAGMGLSFPLVADLVLASEEATFVAAYTAAGLTPDGGITHGLTRAVGERRAREFVMTNTRLGATKAAEWGLVSKVVPSTELETEARKEAIRLAAGPTNALKAAKTLLRDASQKTLSQQLTDEKSAILTAARGLEGREGIAAFVEKRRPNF